MKSDIEAFIASYNSRKKPEVSAALVEAGDSGFTVSFTGGEDGVFEDFKAGLESAAQLRLLIEKVEKKRKTSLVKFTVHERGPADDILKALSGYYEGTPPAKA